MAPRLPVKIGYHRFRLKTRHVRMCDLSFMCPFVRLMVVVSDESTWECQASQEGTVMPCCDVAYRFGLPQK